MSSSHINTIGRAAVLSPLLDNKILDEERTFLAYIRLNTNDIHLPMYN